MSVYGQGVFVQRRWNGVIGWLLLTVAVVLHRMVASKTAWQLWQDRRDAALRSAYRRGVLVEELAAGLGLTPGWIRQVLASKRPPEVEEAA